MARLEQLLEAEITTLALRTPRPLTLQSLLDVATKSSADELAQLLHEELPVHFAQRIKMIEALPEWHCKPSIAVVREMYMTSFKELRLADPQRPEHFYAQIRSIKERHSQTKLLVGGLRQYASELSVLEINEWLDKFFSLRLSTNMLMSQYIQDGAFLDLPDSPYRTSVDPQCNIPRIASYAASIVRQLSLLRYGVAPTIQVHDYGTEAIPFIPKYFLYIASEILKNAVRATVEWHTPHADVDGVCGGEGLPPVHVAVSGDELGCCCRISDEGGGIPKAQLPHIWSYLYTTAEPLEMTLSRKSVDVPADPRLDQDGMGFGMDSCGAPLAGSGCGLPLSRLYATHFEGSVELQSMPRFGTDVYVYVNGLGHNERLTPL